MTETRTAAFKNYLLCLADDEFIIGHRNSEWTGLGPIMEEDIAFSSMAQDELGHALGIYEFLHALGDADPDALAFKRAPSNFRNSILTELPRGDYAFSLIRQLLYDAAEAERFSALASHPNEELRNLASKILQEERYHWMHDTSMVKRLACATEESRIRMQAALNEAFPYALGMFELFEGHDELVAAGLAPSEETIRQNWMNRICPLLVSYGLDVPAHVNEDQWVFDGEPVFGGRRGKHTEHLLNIIDAIQLLTKADPEAVW